MRLEQVVAMEPDFSLLTRIWCIAELVEARRLHLPQVGAPWHLGQVMGPGGNWNRNWMEKYGKVGEHLDEFLVVSLFEKEMRQDRDFSAFQPTSRGHHDPLRSLTNRLPQTPHGKHGKDPV